jgi:nitronate monooxygenase
MWSDRRLIELFQIEHPLILSPMAGFCTAELAAAVSNAGGLGSIGCGPVPPQQAAKIIADLRRLTTKPISVNFFCHDPAKSDPARERAWHDRLSPYHRELGLDPAITPPRVDLAPFGEDACGVIESTRPEVVSFHFGLPAPHLVARIKAAGCKIISSATTVEEACWLEAHGADAVIAQGLEAGGHRGMFLDPDHNRALASQVTTLALVPQVAAAVSVPVIAAGGIADGRGIAAALALGASGVQMGTAFLLCPEAATPPVHRGALRDAGRHKTVVTNVFTGHPARVLANRFVVEAGPMSDAVPDFPFPLGELAPLRAAAERNGSHDFTPLWSGQSAALTREMPARALMETLTSEAVARVGELGRGPVAGSRPSPLRRARA